MNFLIDAQLPPMLCGWIENTSQHFARHVSELEQGLTSKDNQIWKVALQTNEVIVTKDFDFYDRALVSNDSPVILHINLGNCSNKKLVAYIDEHWETLIKLFQQGHKLISCNPEEIEFW